MEKRRTGRLVGWLGVILSLVYLAALWWLVEGRIGTLRTMDLNEVGDFLAGAFGPLAILWLVLGFFQQGFELRQNSAALELQAKELANSVEQQTELARVAREQLVSDREVIASQQRQHQEDMARQRRLSQPRFSFKLTGGTHHPQSSVHKVQISNFGAPCIDVSCQSFKNEVKMSKTRFPRLDSSIHGDTEFITPRHPDFAAFDLQIDFIDRLGEPGTRFFVVHAEVPQGNDFTRLRFEESK